MTFRIFAIAAMLGGLSLGASAAFVPYNVSVTFDDGGTLMGTITVDTTAACGPGIGLLGLVSSAGSLLSGAAYTGPSDFSSCGLSGVSSFEDQSTPGGTFLGLYTTAQIALNALASTYNFSSLSSELFVNNGVGVQRNLVSGAMTQVSAVPEPQALALLGLALAIGAITRRTIARV